LQRGVSRGSVAFVTLGAMAYILIVRLLARKALHIIRKRGRLATHRMLLVGSLPETLFVHKDVSRNVNTGLVTRRHPPEREPSRVAPLPGTRARLLRARSGRPRARAQGPTRSPSAARLGPNPMSCAASRGSWKARASTSSWPATDRLARPARAHPSDRGPAAAARGGAQASPVPRGSPKTCSTGSRPRFGCCSWSRSSSVLAC
jgi:hypothetical protein